MGAKKGKKQTANKGARGRGAGGRRVGRLPGGPSVQTAGRGSKGVRSVLKDTIGPGGNSACRARSSVLVSNERCTLAGQRLPLWPNEAKRIVRHKDEPDHEAAVH